MAAHGWFAARPSGTENVYKIYAESFRDQAHLERIVSEAQHIVDSALATGQTTPGTVKDPQSPGTFGTERQS